MKFILLSRIDDRQALDFTAALGADLMRSGFFVAYDAGTAAAIGTSGIPLEEADGDVVVCVGGDGTILFSIQRMKRQIPVVGINWGEVGFLADLEPGEAFTFLTGLGKGYAIERRMRISLSIGGKPMGDALNEALVVTSRPAKMLRFVVVVDGVPAERFRADGILMSTPTGSTAYAMSAGGPIVDPRIEGVLLVPLAPYLLSSRPHLISADRTLEIRVETAKPAKLVIDGQRTVELSPDAAIRVVRAPEPALFVDTGRNFFEKVNSKLRRL